MEVFRPSSLPDVLEVRAAQPEALPIAGGTDLMVELNFGRRRPEAILDVSRLPELQEIRREGATVFLGAGVPYARWEAIGARPRRPATPLPALAVYDAKVVLASAAGSRQCTGYQKILDAVRLAAERMEGGTA